MMNSLLSDGDFYFGRRKLGIIIIAFILLNLNDWLRHLVRWTIGWTWLAIHIILVCYADILYLHYFVNQVIAFLSFKIQTLHQFEDFCLCCQIANHSKYYHDFKPNYLHFSQPTVLKHYCHALATIGWLFVIGMGFHSIFGDRPRYPLSLHSVFN